MHLSAGDGFTVFSHPMKAGLVFLSLFIAGPGRYAIDQKIVGYLNRKQD
jgi:putative oxidoreductase